MKKNYYVFMAIFTTSLLMAANSLAQSTQTSTHTSDTPLTFSNDDITVTLQNETLIIEGLEVKGKRHITIDETESTSPYDALASDISTQPHFNIPILITDPTEDNVNIEEFINSYLIKAGNKPLLLSLEMKSKIIEENEGRNILLLAGLFIETHSEPNENKNLVAELYNFTELQNKELESLKDELAPQVEQISGLLIDDRDYELFPKNLSLTSSVNLGNLFSSNYENGLLRLNYDSRYSDKITSGGKSTFLVYRELPELNTPSFSPTTQQTTSIEDFFNTYANIENEDEDEILYFYDRKLGQKAISNEARNFFLSDAGVFILAIFQLQNAAIYTENNDYLNAINEMYNSFTSAANEQQKEYLSIYLDEYSDRSELVYLNEIHNLNDK